MSDNPLHSLEHALPSKGTKIGKHSVWLYGGIIGGVIILYIWYTRSSSSSSDTTTTSDSLPEVSGDALGSSSTGDSSGTDSTTSEGTGTTGTTNVYYTQEGTVADVTPIKTLSTGGVRTKTKTNYSWEKDAVAFLTAAGVGGQNATKAISKYLNGGHLSYHEHVLVNQAIKNVGLNPKQTAKTATFTTKAQATKKAKQAAKAKTEKKAAKASKAIKASKPKKTIKVKKKAKKR